MKKSIYVLGTGLSHDGSACLIKDGRIAVAISKERLTRIKHDGHNDNAAISYCLEAAGIELKDVAVVVQNANYGNGGNDKSWYHGPRLLADYDNLITISHHLAHAYSAAAPSPFTSRRVLGIGGFGSNFDSCVDLGD